MDETSGWMKLPTLLWQLMAFNSINCGYEFCDHYSASRLAGATEVELPVIPDGDYG